MMASLFYEAIDAIRDNNITHLEKLLKQNSALIEERINKRSLLLFAILHDRLRACRLLTR